MRILMVNKFLYPRGGAETYVLGLGKELEHRGHELQYFGMYDERNVLHNDCGLYTKPLDFHAKTLDTITYPATIIYSKDAKEKIRKIIRSFKPDVAHLNNINFHLTPSIIEALSEEGIPIIMTAHDYQMVCPNHLLYIPSEGKICTTCVSELSKKCIKEKCIHQSTAKSILGYMEAALYRKKKTYEKIDTIICPSQFMKETLDRVGMFKGKTVFIRNFSEEIPEAEPVEKEDYILYFGRLYEEKGIRNLVEAMKMLPEIHLKVAGSGPLEPLLKEAENIEYVGFQTGEDLKDLIRKAKFSIYPSVWFENCPLSIIESQKLGTPCLMTGIGGMRELSGSGLTIHKTTAESVMNSIRSLYYSPGMLRDMQEELAELIANYPNLSSYTSSVEEIYRRLSSNIEEGSANFSA